MGRMRHLLVATGLVGSVLLAGSSVSYYEEALPSTMNPLFARSMVDYRAHEFVFDRLFYRDPIDNEIVSMNVSRLPRRLAIAAVSGITAPVDNAVNVPNQPLRSPASWSSPLKT